jgi:diguanylate cyclase (GGDEF)-like protein
LDAVGASGEGAGNESGPPPGGGLPPEWAAVLHAAVAVGIVLVERESGPLYLNAEAERLLGRALADLREGWVAQPDTAWMDRLGAPLAGEEHPFRIARETGRPAAGSLWLPGAGEPPVIVDLVVRPAGRLLVCTLIDRTPLSPANPWARDAELLAARADAARGRAEARTDPLTGLLNRRGFEEVYARERARATRTGATFGVLVFDLDRFKEVNDLMGHEMGDVVLAEVGLRLRGLARSTDRVARLGGDEFVVLLPDATEDVLENVANRLRDHLGVSVGPFVITVSVGSAVWRGASALDPLAVADAAMYAQKASGRRGDRPAGG